MWYIIVNAPLFQRSGDAFSRRVRMCFKWHFLFGCNLQDYRVYAQLEVCISFVLDGSEWWDSFWFYPSDQVGDLLTHSGWVTHVYASINKPALVQTMACRLVGAKPLSEPMLLFYFNWILGNKTLLIFVEIHTISFKKMHLTKCIVNCDHFVSASMC